MAASVPCEQTLLAVAQELFDADARKRTLACTQAADMSAEQGRLHQSVQILGTLNSQPCSAGPSEQKPELGSPGSQQLLSRLPQLPTPLKREHWVDNDLSQQSGPVDPACATRRPRRKCLVPSRALVAKLDQKVDALQGSPEPTTMPSCNVPFADAADMGSLQQTHVQRHQSSQDEGNDGAMSLASEEPAAPTVKKKKYRPYVMIKDQELADVFGGTMPHLPQNVQLQLKVHGRLQTEEKGTLRAGAQGKGMVKLHVAEPTRKQIPYLRRSEALDFSWSVSTMASGADAGQASSTQLPVMVLDLRPTMMPAETATVLDADAAQHPATPPADALPSERGSKKRRTNTEIVSKVHLDGPQPLAHLGLLHTLEPLTAAATEVTKTKTRRLRSPGLPNNLSSEEQELLYKGKVLEMLHDRGVMATETDLARYYVYSYHQIRTTGQPDKYFRVRHDESSQACITLRSFVAVVDFIATRMQHDPHATCPPATPERHRPQGQPQQSTVDQQMQLATQPAAQPEPSAASKAALEPVPPQTAAGETRCTPPSAAVELLAHLCASVDYVADFVAITERQKIMAAAIAVALSIRALHNPDMQRLLQELPSCLPAAVSDTVAMTACSTNSAPEPMLKLLPLLAGSVSVLPSEQLQRAKHELGMQDDEQVQTELLVRAARAAAAMHTAGDGEAEDQCSTLSEAQVLHALSLTPRLADLLSAPDEINLAEVLLPAYEQCCRASEAGCRGGDDAALIIAACLWHAQHGRVSVQQGIMAELVMGLFSRAFTAGQDCFTHLRAALKLMHKSLVSDGSTAGGLAVPRKVLIACFQGQAVRAAKAAIIEQQCQQPGNGVQQQPGDRQQLSVMLDATALKAGVALDAQQEQALEAKVADVLWLCHRKGRNMKLELAVAVVAAGHTPDAAGSTKVLDLLQMVSSLAGAFGQE